MNCYSKLHNGETLSNNDLSSLSNQTILPHQWSAFAFQLFSKPTLTSHESIYLKNILEDIPESLGYLINLFPIRKAELSISSQTPKGCKIRNDLMSLLNDTYREGDIGKSRIQNFISEFVAGRISAEFTSIWLMKVCYNGLSDKDTKHLTLAMRDSGSTYDYRSYSGLNHSKILRRYPTGAISEKVALILPSLLSVFSAEYNIASPFLVARSLGFTGGTWDKLRSIPEFNFPLPGDETIACLKQCGVAMTVTHGNINPADRKMYQLRSATGTIESQELVIASIASKQLAVPADHLLMDVRYGPGAFFKTKDLAEKLATNLVEAINFEGTNCFYCLSDTLQPNGMAIGNSLEVFEALAVMGIVHCVDWDHRALSEQRNLVIEFFSKLMSRAFQTISEEQWRQAANRKFNNRSVSKAFFKILKAHGVSDRVRGLIKSNPKTLLMPSYNSFIITSEVSGHLVNINQRQLGNIVNFDLGAGGNDYGDELDIYAGLILGKRLGDIVEVGEPLCRLFFNKNRIKDTENLQYSIRQCFSID